MARRALNRGLGALIPPKKVQSDITEEPARRAQEMSEQEVEDTEGKTKAAGEGTTEQSAAERGITALRLSQIIPNEGQPRKTFDSEKISELAASIREHGIIQPLVVRKQGEYYQLIAGERRWRAAKEAGLKEVPVYVQAYSEQEAMEVALIENLQREDLDPIEEAEAYKKLMDTFRLTQEQAAQKVGKARTSVTNALRLLKLARPVQHLLQTGEISMGHAKALLGLADQEMQVNAAHQIQQKKLSVRETEKLVKHMLKPAKPRKQEVDEQLQLAYRNLEDRMQKAVGTKVSIQAHGEKGKIEIEYYSQEDLERIIDLIG